MAISLNNEFEVLSGESGDYEFVDDVDRDPDYNESGPRPRQLFPPRRRLVLYPSSSHSDSEQDSSPGTLSLIGPQDKKSPVKEQETQIRTSKWFLKETETQEKDM